MGGQTKFLIDVVLLRSRRKLEHHLHSQSLEKKYMYNQPITYCANTKPILFASIKTHFKTVRVYPQVFVGYTYVRRTMYIEIRKLSLVHLYAIFDNTELVSTAARF